MNQKEQKLLTGLKTIFENYKKGTFNTTEFVFFATRPETELTLATLPKTMSRDIAKQLYLAPSPIELHPDWKTAEDFLEKNKAKILIPMSYRHSVSAYEKLGLDLKNSNGVFSVNACIEFIRTSRNTLLAKLFATYLLFEIDFSKKETKLGKESENEILQNARKLEIPKYAYYGYEITHRLAVSEKPESSSGSEDSEEIDKSLGDASKAGQKLLQTEMDISAASSAHTPFNYFPIFSPETKEPSNQAEKLKETNQFLAEQRATKQKLAADHQKRLQKFLLNQAKEKEDLEAKQAKERQAFFGLEQPASTPNSKQSGVGLSAST